MTNNIDRIGYEIGVGDQYIEIVKKDLEKWEIIDEITSDEFENNLKHFRSISFYEQRYSDIKEE